MSKREEIMLLLADRCDLVPRGYLALALADSILAIAYRPSEGDDEVNAAITAYHQRWKDHQGFLYGKSHVIRDFANGGHIVWSRTETDNSSDEYEHCHQEMMDEIGRIAFRAALAAAREQGRLEAEHDAIVETGKRVAAKIDGGDVAKIS